MDSKETPNLTQLESGMVQGSRTDWDAIISILEEEIIYTDDPEPLVSLIETIDVERAKAEREHNRGSMYFMEEYELPLTEDEFALIEDTLRFQESE